LDFNTGPITLLLTIDDVDYSTNEDNSEINRNARKVVQRVGGGDNSWYD